MASRIRVAVITNIIPSYRSDFFRRLFADPNLKLTVFCQKKIPGINLMTVEQNFADHVVEVGYLGAKRELIGWQNLPLKKILHGFDVYFIYGNPRVLSNIYISLLLKLLGKTVVIEGQLHTASSSQWTKAIRLLWWRFYDYIFLYNDTEVRLLKQMSGFSQKIIIGMNNGLDQTAINRACQHWPEQKLLAWQNQQLLNDKLILLSCARLEAKNHFEWLIKCLPELKKRYPNLIWCVIGDGEEQLNLQKIANELHVSDSIRWLGALFDEEQLAPWFLTSKALVHPGAVGLSLLHAFGYGLPVITHDSDAQHMPEFAALQNDINGKVYRYGDLNSMIDTIALTLEDASALGKNAKYTAETHYNTEIMAQRFLQMSMLANAKNPTTDVQCR